MPWGPGGRSLTLTSTCTTLSRSCQSSAVPLSSPAAFTIVAVASATRLLGNPALAQAPAIAAAASEKTINVLFDFIISSREVAESSASQAQGPCAYWPDMPSVESSSLNPG